MCQDLQLWIHFFDVQQALDGEGGCVATWGICIVCVAAYNLEEDFSDN